MTEGRRKNVHRGFLKSVVGSLCYYSINGGKSRKRRAGVSGGESLPRKCLGEGYKMWTNCVRGGKG